MPELTELRKTERYLIQLIGKEFQEIIYLEDVLGYTKNAKLVVEAKERLNEHSMKMNDLRTEIARYQ